MPVFPLPSTAVVLIILAYLFYAVYQNWDHWRYFDFHSLHRKTKLQDQLTEVYWTPYEALLHFKKYSSFADITSLKV